jgi:rhamnosyltransferase
MFKIINSNLITFDRFLKPPSVIVLLSTFNNSKYIKEQIFSIINQEEIDLKLVVRDDGSTDETKEILEKIKLIFPDKIYLEFGFNWGIHKSYHYLYNKYYDAEYISFADGDDLWDLDKLIVAINMLQKFNASLYVGSSRLVNQNNEIISQNKSKVSNYYLNGKGFLLHPGFQGCTLVMKHQLIRTIVCESSNPILAHDNWIPQVAFYTSDIIIDQTEKMSYRQHNQSWTGNRTKIFSFTIKKIKYFFKGLRRYSVLANEILKSFTKFLSKKDYRFLNIISKSKSIRNRIKLFLDPNFTKKGFFKNMIFKLYILIFGL